METENVKALIEAGIPGAKVEVTGDGRHFEATVTSALFGLFRHGYSPECPFAAEAAFLNGNQRGPASAASGRPDIFFSTLEIA